MADEVQQIEPVNPPVVEDPPKPEDVPPQDWQPDPVAAQGHLMMILDHLVFSIKHLVNAFPTAGLGHVISRLDDAMGNFKDATVPPPAPPEDPPADAPPPEAGVEPAPVPEWKPAGDPGDETKP